MNLHPGTTGEVETELPPVCVESKTGDLKNWCSGMTKNLQDNKRKIDILVIKKIISKGVRPLNGLVQAKC